MRYHYNPNTCRYEPWHPSPSSIRTTLFVFVTLTFLLAGIAYAVFSRRVGSPREMRLQKENKTLQAEWKILNERLHRTQEQLSEFVKKDDETYRSILGAAPLPATIRQAGSGGAPLFPEQVQEIPALYQLYTSLYKLRNQVKIQDQSFVELEQMLADKQQMWSSRPAIQPISNKQLDKLHMTYGSRFHPIFHVWRVHKGLDFAASKGTPVYATGDGQVLKVYYSDSYGKVIYIDHGYGYETRYAHLSGFAVQEGEKIKRGHIIGYVGNTGTSVSPHLHYEILYNGAHINPIHFFQRDLSNREYERLIELGNQQQEALD